MAESKVALTQGAYEARSVIADAQRCVNLFPEMNPEDAEVPVTHYPTPGLTAVGTGAPAPVPAVLPLDIIVQNGFTVGFGYAMRLLSFAYTGPIFNIKNNNSGATTDFFADASGTVSNAAITLFLNGATGSIEKLYDQSGQGNHLVASPASTSTVTLNAINGHAVLTNTNPNQSMLCYPTTYDGSSGKVSSVLATKLGGPTDSFSRNGCAWFTGTNGVADTPLVGVGYYNSSYGAPLRRSLTSMVASRQPSGLVDILTLISDGTVGTMYRTGVPILKSTGLSWATPAPLTIQLGWGVFGSFGSWSSNPASLLPFLEWYGLQNGVMDAVTQAAVEASTMSYWSVVVPSGAPTFDTANSGGFNLSNSNYTATHASSTQSIVPTSDFKYTGKWYSEAHCDAAGGNYPQFGLTNTMCGMGNNSIGHDVNGLGYSASGAINYNNSAIATILSWTTNYTVGMAMDLTAKKVWFRIKQDGGAWDGKWNNSGSASPLTGVGGYDLTAMMGGLAVSPSFGAGNGSGGATLNNTTTVFVMPLPSGYLGW